MARVDVLMPQMGESIAEGTLSKWLKKVGDEVKRDEPLFEISTDKVDAEIPAPTAGVLAEIKVQEGQTVPVQTLVAVLETEKGAAAAPSPAAPPVAAAQRAPAASGGAAVSAPPPPVPRPPSPVPVAPKGDGAETAEDRLRKKSTPLVRKIAAEHRVDISTIPGSGFAGRVTKQDILGFIERGPVSVAPAPSPQLPAPSVEAWPGDRVEPWSKIRKITADHMIMSRRTSAHVASFFEVDFTRVAQLRAKAGATEKPTFLAYIVKACAVNLRKHPVVNAAVSGDSTIYRADINIGIGARPYQEAVARRHPARHVHDHEPRRVRPVRGHPDHQPAAGRDPGRRGDREAPQGHPAARRQRHDRHPDDGHAHDVVRSPDRGWRRRGSFPGRRQEDAAGVPGGSGLKMPKVLTAARVRVPAPNETEYLTTLRELCQFADARGQRIWLFRNAKDSRLFIEFSESPTEMSHRAQASRLPEEIQLEKRLQSLATYAPDAWELWSEVSLTAPSKA